MVCVTRKLRKNMLDVILYRRYQQPLADWDPSDRLLMFVRKDIASQVWNLGAAPPLWPRRRRSILSWRRTY